MPFFTLKVSHFHQTKGTWFWDIPICWTTIMIIIINNNQYSQHRAILFLQGEVPWVASHCKVTGTSWNPKMRVKTILLQDRIDPHVNFYQQPTNERERKRDKKGGHRRWSSRRKENIGVLQSSMLKSFEGDVQTVCINQSNIRDKVQCVLKVILGWLPDFVDRYDATREPTSPVASSVFHLCRPFPLC